jgi:hypothetical protein
MRRYGTSLGWWCIGSLLTLTAFTADLSDGRLGKCPQTKVIKSMERLILDVGQYNVRAPHRAVFLLNGLQGGVAVVGDNRPSDQPLFYVSNLITIPQGSGIVFWAIIFMGPGVGGMTRWLRCNGMMCHIHCNNP